MTVGGWRETWSVTQKARGQAIDSLSGKQASPGWEAQIPLHCELSLNLAGASTVSAACCQVSSRFRARMEAFNREDGHQNKRWGEKLQWKVRKTGSDIQKR